MADIDLIVNNERLDLAVSEKIALVFQVQKLSELNDKLGAFSRSFVIPMTDNNKRILEYINDYNTASHIAYQNNYAALKVDGNVINTGKLIVENDGLTETAARLTYYFNGSPFFALVNNIKLSELIIDNGEHLWNRLNIYQSCIGGISSNLSYIYPIIDYGSENTYCLEDAATIITDRMLPATKMVSVKSAIENLTGYQLKGDILSTTNFTDLIIPFSKDKFLRDKNYALRNTWSAGDSQLGIVMLPYTPTAIQFSSISLPVFNNLGTAFMFPDRVLLHIKIVIQWQLPVADDIGFTLQRDSLNYPAWFDYEPTNAATDYISSPFNATIITSDGFNTYNGIISANGCNTGLIPAAPSYETTIEFDIYTLPHFKYEVITDHASNNSWTLNESFIAANYIADNNTSEADRVIRLGDETTAWSRAWVSGTTPLPDWTIGNFIKAISQLFGCFILCNEVTKEVELYQIKQLYDNIPYAVEWSNKVVNLDKAYWNTRANGYGQQSILKYNNEEYLGTYGSYSMPVNDDTLPLSVDILQLPFTSNKAEVRLIDKLVPRIKRINRNGEIGGGTQQHILYLNCSEFGGTPIKYSSPIGLTSSDFTLYDNLTTYYKDSRVKQDTGMFGGMRYFVYINETGRSGTAPINIFGQLMTDLYKEVHIGSPVEYNATTWIPYCYFNYGGTIHQLGFDTYLFENYYRYLNYISNNYKLLNVYMKLSATDVNNLDFRKPVYLQQFNSYFFIEKINDWIADIPTKVTLLKLQ